MSSISVFFARTFGELFVPHDNLYTQAKKIITNVDVDGDGVIDMDDPKQRGSFNDFFRKGFLYVDSLGWNNGVVSVRELRNTMRKYDVSGDPKTGGPNNALEGEELTRLVQDVNAFPG